MSHPEPTPEKSPEVQGRLSSTLVALILPLGILSICAAIAWTWRDELPDLVATHWGADGVDGVSSLSFTLVSLSLIGAILAVGFWVVAFWWGRSASTRRIANATSVWVSSLIGIILLGTLHAQRGLADPYDVGKVDGVIILAVVIACVLGVIAAFITPGDAERPTSVPPPADASRVPLAQSERAVWVARTSSGPGVLITAVAIVASTITVLLTSDAWLLGVPVLLALLAVAMFTWRVRVDASGLTVRSILGLPRSHQPIEEIVSADVVSIRALRDFGGWGWRAGRDSRSGVVLRSGEALEVTQTGGRAFVVTVADAATAAALLNTYADRNRPAPGPDVSAFE